jgi:Uma2 family endonuclease
MVMTRESDAPASFLLQDFLALETPEGYRAELIDGEIVVTPPPDGTHEGIIWHITEQVTRKSAIRMAFSGNKGLVLPARASVRAHVIPDGTFAPAELRLFFGAPSWMSPDGVAMVIEVTSSRPDTDRGAKRHAYAMAGIPLYLLADRERQRIALFSDPRGDDYAGTASVPFGSSLELPKPFDFTLDTAEFGDLYLVGAALPIKESGQCRTHRKSSQA